MSIIYNLLYMQYWAKRFEILIQHVQNKNYSEIYSFVVAFTRVRYK